MVLRPTPGKLADAEPLFPRVLACDKQQLGAIRADACCARPREAAAPLSGALRPGDMLRSLVGVPRRALARVGA